jgi:hypothetical protein
MQGATLLFGAGATAALMPKTAQRLPQDLWPQGLAVLAATAELWHLMM